jgi:hypothetical protein
MGAMTFPSRPGGLGPSSAARSERVGPWVIIVERLEAHELGITGWPACTRFLSETEQLLARAYECPSVGAPLPAACVTARPGGASGVAGWGP